ncbi:hypothetical protein [Limnoglobus roseus]|uniref:VWA domain-containing protein n=1 Tax=Limnoglobus roseus TaxID=2598579 RepID=A0A5C1A7P2_9BACT|nr:hypothetical protein [Limnoglobus roseus]QEL14006.1 VWA domain-containing protein [Limnoglobus roseus]
MASTTDYFLSTRPAYPWSEYPVGLPALGLVAAVLVGVTVWTYLKHPSATRRRVFIILSLRIAALIVALLTALRPSVGIQEDPKVPSVLPIGIDLSESMTIKDEFNSQTRIAAVRKILEKCEPTLEELRTEQNVNVVFYALGKTDFNEATSAYDANLPADSKRSDYGVYLSRTFEKWQTERFVRAHLVIGDGADNGTTYAAQTEAARWRAIAPLHTFAVGSKTTPPNAKDVAVVAVAADPSPVPIKNDLVIKLVVNAFGFAGATVPIVVKFDGVDVVRENHALAKDANNEIEIKVKAPDKPGEVRLKVEIPIESVPGDANPANNSVETYLTVTKEGLRILMVDRHSFEMTMASDVLRADKRFDFVRVLREGADPATPGERELFDFDNRAYDVIILGNVSQAQLKAIDPKLPEKIRDQVLKRNVGLLFGAGDASYAGDPNRPLDNGWKGSALEAILPVSLTNFPAVPDSVYKADDKRFQCVPTIDGLRFLMKVNGELSKEAWDKLNAQAPNLPPFSRLNAITKLGVPKPGATIYAVASDGRDLVPAGLTQPQAQGKPPYLLVGTQFGDANGGRVLAWGGMNTRLWRSFGRRATPPNREGFEIHAQFWRRLVLYLAHQEEDEGAAFARPEFRRLPVNGKQSVKLGLRTTGGGDAIDPKFDIRILAPGQKPEEGQSVKERVDPKDGYKFDYEPKLPGEYTVMLKAEGKDAAGKELKGEATARFISYPDTSDELLRAAADHDYLEKLSKAGGGKAYRLDDLPGFLKELKGQPIVTVKPKPRFVPDWRRNHSHGFLPGWLVTFVLILGAEWALRRLWGMV